MLRSLRAAVSLCLSVSGLFTSACTADRNLGNEGSGGGGGTSSSSTSSASSSSTSSSSTSSSTSSSGTSSSGMGGTFACPGSGGTISCLKHQQMCITGQADGKPYHSCIDYSAVRPECAADPSCATCYYDPACPSCSMPSPPGGYVCTSDAEGNLTTTVDFP